MRTDFLDAWLVFATRDATADVRKKVREFLGERFRPNGERGVKVGLADESLSIGLGQNTFVQKNVDKGAN